MTDYPTLIEKLERSHGGVPCVATAEIRRLIADNEALRKANLDCVDHYNDARSEIELLRTQVAELSKDVERYRWLRLQHWSDSDIAVVLNPKNSTLLGSVCPSQSYLDQVVDAAIDAQKGKV